MTRKRTIHVAAVGIAVAALGPSPALSHPGGEVETVALFDADALETPESLVIDSQGNRYVSLALTGEIRKIARDGTQTTHAVLPIGEPLTPCVGFFALIAGLAIDQSDRIYVSVGSCVPDNRGVWRVDPDGTKTQIANLPEDSFPNGITLHRDHLYVADSNLGLVWRLNAAGGEATVWVSDPLLLRNPGGALPGANGIRFFRGDFYIAVTDTANIVAVPLQTDGSAGPVRVHATTPVGCDDFSLDVFGTIYCASPADRVLSITQEGEVAELLTGDDDLDGPTSVLFGRLEGERSDIYITNAAFPFISTRNRPSLMRLHLGIPGAPGAVGVAASLEAVDGVDVHRPRR